VYIPRLTTIYSYLNNLRDCSVGNADGKDLWNTTWGGLRWHDIITTFRVTVERFWIDDKIYWTLRYSAWLQFKIHYYTYAHNSVHSHDFNCSFSVAASNSGRSPSSGFPNYPRRQLQAPHSNSSQWLNSSFSHTDSSLINQQIQLTDWTPP
jgi:hypothetical protein